MHHCILSERHIMSTNHDADPRVTTHESIKMGELVRELVQRIKANKIEFDDELPKLLMAAIEHNEDLGILFRRHNSARMYGHPAFQALHGANRC